MAFWKRKFEEAVEEAVEEVLEEAIKDEVEEVMEEVLEAPEEPSIKAEVKGLEAAVGNMKATRERLVGRAQRLKLHIEGNPDHPKVAAYRGELKGILKELGAREELIREIIGA